VERDAVIVVEGSAVEMAAEGCAQAVFAEEGEECGGVAEGVGDGAGEREVSEENGGKGGVECGEKCAEGGESIETDADVLIGGAGAGVEGEELEVCVRKDVVGGVWEDDVVGGAAQGGVIVMVAGDSVDGAVELSQQFLDAAECG